MLRLKYTQKKNWSRVLHGRLDKKANIKSKENIEFESAIIQFNHIKNTSQGQRKIVGQYPYIVTLAAITITNLFFDLIDNNNHTLDYSLNPIGFSNKAYYLHCIHYQDRARRSCFV